MKWEDRARIIYAGHDKLDKAIAAGRLMDNRLDGSPVVSLFGDMGNSSFFDLQQYFAYFDGEVLKARGLKYKP